MSAICDLPGRADAERAIEQALRSGDPGWLATVVADHVHLIHERCGYGVGDAVLEEIAGHLATLRGARVYRWTATSFVVISARRPGIALPALLEATITVLPLASVRSPGELVSRLDHHVALRVAAA
jgi:GGDEF domain-containing protein